MNGDRQGDRYELGGESLDASRKVIFYLRLVSKRHAENFINHVDTDLTQPQYAALFHLYEHGECSQNRLGRSIGLDTASIAGVTRRLEARNLVLVAQSTEDRRRVVIDLTAAGRELTSRSIGMSVRANEDTLAPLSQAELLQLTALLERLLSCRDVGQNS